MRCCTSAPTGSLVAFARSACSLAKRSFSLRSFSLRSFSLRSFSASSVLSSAGVEALAAGGVGVAGAVTTGLSPMGVSAEVSGTVFAGAVVAGAVPRFPMSPALGSQPCSLRSSSACCSGVRCPPDLSEKGEGALVMYTAIPKATARPTKIPTIKPTTPIPR